MIYKKMNKDSDKKFLMVLRAHRIGKSVSIVGSKVGNLTRGFGVPIYLLLMDVYRKGEVPCHSE